MINIVISPEGEIIISQEPTEERISMTNVWNISNGEGEPSPETIDDETKADMFRQGWNSALEEVVLNRKSDRLDEFLEETGAVKPSDPSDPHRNEPEGTGEDQSDIRVINVDGGVTFGVVRGERIPDDVPAAGWAIGDPISSEKIPSEPIASVKIPAYSVSATEAAHAANEIGLDVIRPVKDSGEPEKEAEIIAADYNEGTWTMSNDELQSRLDEARRDGLQRGLDAPRLTTQRSLDIIAVEINNQILQEWDEKMSSDDEVKEGISKGEYARRFAATLAKRLGYEVSA